MCTLNILSVDFRNASGFDSDEHRQMDGSQLSRLFERLREKDQPPLLEQLDMVCDFRRELDSAIEDTWG